MNAVTENRKPETTTPGRPEPALLTPVDVIENATGITLFADLPGVARDKLNLRVEGDQLGIEAELSLPMPQGLDVSHAEVTLQRWRRTFTLSKELDADQISADLNQGVLRVHIPKAAHAQPRKISVQVS
jgi:HSP20 family molecular chaperone IbpA